MSERKVLTKYYPPDFDPSALGRKRKPKDKDAGRKVQTVTLMAPFSMKCTYCGEFIYKGRKFNARKEVPLDERYLNVQIYRFYIRCTRCSGEIIFRTDPKNQDYAMVSGAKRNTDPWKRGLGDKTDEEETDEQRLDRLEREQAEEAGEAAAERNAMVELEAKTADAKREMAVADALDEIRTRNARLERADRDGVEFTVARPEDEERARQEREDEEAARLAFAKARAAAVVDTPIEEEQEGQDMGNGHAEASGSGSATDLTPVLTSMPPPPLLVGGTTSVGFKKQVKKKKDHAALLGIKKKPSLV